VTQSCGIWIGVGVALGSNGALLCLQPTPQAIARLLSLDDQVGFYVELNHFAAMDDVLLSVKHAG
jgi:hypothetical protein